MSCQLCTGQGRDRAAAARCRICSLEICSEHLAEMLGPDAPRSSCGHVFVASGWLARALDRSTAAVAPA